MICIYKLEVGMEIRLNTEMGGDGAQASSVQLIGKHPIVGQDEQVVM